MKKAVYLDYGQCVKLFKQASENDGRVVIEAKGLSPFEITVDPEYAKKAWDEEERKVLKIFTDIYGLPDEAICKEVKALMGKEI